MAARWRSGHEFDGAYFQSPLRGNYEVHCRLSHFEFREAMLMTAGIANALKYTHDRVKVFHVHPPAVELPVAKPITPKVLQWHDYKVVVKDGRFTSFVNGQKLYEEALPDQPDPWLAVVGLAGYTSQTVRDIVITGEPEIPDELDLLAQPDLNSWLTNYYEGHDGKPAFAWTLSGDELVSERIPAVNSKPGRLKFENIIRYHRPMIEDGEISYEFYYDPETKLTVEDPNRREVVNGIVQNMKRTVDGRALVHPALDRLVCLLEPDGVKIHWLTDGRHDRTGSKAGNSEEVKTLTKDGTLPLKPGAWNAIKLSTKGDTLTIELNGEVILTRDIEPTNLRNFGLFHYANESNVRVRNVHYRGDWPKKLPSVKQQELAGVPASLAQIPDAVVPDAEEFDFTRSKFDKSVFRYHWDAAAAAKCIQPTADGLRFVLPAGETKTQTVGINPKRRLSGDFIATIEYAGLKTTPPKGSWGSGLSFKVHIEGTYETGFEARQRETSRSTNIMWQTRAPHGEYIFASESLTDFPASGRMRIVRRGEVMYFLMADTGSDEFRLITQRAFGTADIRILAIQADASDAAAGTEFVVKNLSLRAAKITKEN